MRQRLRSLPPPPSYKRSRHSASDGGRRPGTPPPSRSARPQSRLVPPIAAAVQESPCGCWKEFRSAAATPCWPPRPPGLALCPLRLGGGICLASAWQRAEQRRLPTFASEQACILITDSKRMRRCGSSKPRWPQPWEARGRSGCSTRQGKAEDQQRLDRGPRPAPALRPPWGPVHRQTTGSNLGPRGRGGRMGSTSARGLPPAHRPGRLPRRETA